MALTTEDRPAIGELISLHGHVVDAGEFDRLVDLLTADVVYDVSGFGGGSLVGNRLLARALRPLGLTPSQAEVVRVLDGRGSLTLNGLGDLPVCESGNSPSRLVDRLVSAGLVERRPSDTDRRTITVAPTSALSYASHPNAERANKLASEPRRRTIGMAL
jgi:hypothetical protein